MPTTKLHSERLELAKAISNITAKQESFNKAVETLEKYKNEILVTLDLEIETKKKELEDLKESYQRLQKDGQIDTDQFLREYKYKGAVDILTDAGEVPVPETRLKKMENEIELLRQDRTAEMEELRKEERVQARRNTDLAIRNCELTHKAESAELNAEVKQQSHEIDNLRSTIENLKVELAEQRKLTKDVAQASRAAPITLATPSK